MTARAPSARVYLLPDEVTYESKLAYQVIDDAIVALVNEDTLADHVKTLGYLLKLRCTRYGHRNELRELTRPLLNEAARRMWECEAKRYTQVNLIYNCTNAYVKIPIVDLDRGWMQTGEVAY